MKQTTPDTKQREELALKQQRIRELSDLLRLHEGQKVSAEKRMQQEALKAKLEYRLNMLVLDCKLREADIKMELYKEMLDLLNAK